MALGFKFFKGTESTTVKAIRAVRAKYSSEGLDTVEVQFKSEHKDLPTLELVLTVDQAGELAQQLMSAYEAIRPPISRGWGASQWQGMD